MKRPSVVILGGANGTGLNVGGLKHFSDLDITAIVSMSDSGRSSGKIRRDLDQLPPADILRVLISASSYPYALLKKLLYSERTTGNEKIEGLNLGSLLIALSSRYIGEFMPIIENLERILDCRARVLPSTLGLTELHVRLDNGQVLSSEGTIDTANISNAFVQDVWLDPTAAAYPPTLEALACADVIITGPGDLYTSNIAAMLPVGIQEAIAKSSATIVYVAGNKYSIGGEPAPRTLSERVRALEECLPRPVDVVMYDSHVLTHQQQLRYAQQQWGLIEFDVAQINNRQVIGIDLESEGGGIDARKLGEALYSQIIMGKR